MDLSELMNKVIFFSQENPIIAILIALVFIFLIWRRPKFFFGVLLLAFLLFGVIYLIMNAATAGKEQKGKLIQKEEKLIEKTR